MIEFLVDTLLVPRTAEVVTEPRADPTDDRLDSRIPADGPLLVSFGQPRDEVGACSRQRLCELDPFFKLCQPSEARQRGGRLSHGRIVHWFEPTRELVYGIRQVSVAETPDLASRVALGPAELQACLRLLEPIPFRHGQFPQGLGTFTDR